MIESIFDPYFCGVFETENLISLSEEAGKVDYMLKRFDSLKGSFIRVPERY
jgi:hypothetical protein